MGNDIMTNQERKKVMKELLSKVFPSLTVTLFIFLIILLIAALKINFGIYFILLSLGSIIIGFLVFRVSSKNLFQDLQINKVKLINGFVKDKKYRFDYEAGSVTVPVTIFTILTPKVFTREMKKIDIYTVWINDDEFYLEKEDYEKTEVGKEIFIRKSYYSGLFLGLEKINDQE
jgi:hypothetical protein